LYACFCFTPTSVLPFSRSRAFKSLSKSCPLLLVDLLAEITRSQLACFLLQKFIRDTHTGSDLSILTASSLIFATAWMKKVEGKGQNCEGKKSELEIGRQPGSRWWLCSLASICYHRIIRDRSKPKSINLLLLQRSKA